MTRASIKVSTEYLRKCPPQSRLPLSIEMPPDLEKPPLFQSPLPHPEQLESKTTLIQYRPAGSIKQVKQRCRAASISCGVVAREIGKQLDQKLGEFFHITQLTKEMEPPLEVS